MITVNGGTATQRKHAYSMAQFVCDKFGMTPTVEINFRRMTNDDSYGYCCHLDDHEFEVEVKRTLRLRDMLTTLAHELVHVKQYVYNEMPAVIGDGDYWDRPHEVEAHGRECGIFIRWCEKENLAHLKWTQNT